MTLTATTGISRAHRRARRLGSLRQICPTETGKTRVIALIVCLCVFIAGIALIAGGFGSDVIDYNADGKPSDWHVYFDKLYGTDAPTATADVRIPWPMTAAVLRSKTAARALRSISARSMKSAAPPLSASRSITTAR